LGSKINIEISVLVLPDIAQLPGELSKVDTWNLL
jgi:hypothetical protein